MSLSGYANAAYGIGEELRDLLRENEAFEPLLAELSPDVRLTLAKFHKDNLLLVDKVASEPPAKRRRILEKLPLETQFWAIACAAQMAFEAHAVLRRADTEMRPGVQSYRGMILAVQDVLGAPHEEPNCQWPFPTPSPLNQ